MFIIFSILMIAVFAKMLGLAIKLTWGITKVIFGLVLLPLVLIGMVLGGLIYVALPILVIVGLISLLCGGTRRVA